MLNVTVTGEDGLERTGLLSLCHGRTRVTQGKDARKEITRSPSDQRRTAQIESNKSGWIEDQRL